MRKIFLYCMAVMLILSGCASGSYNDRYDDGYAAGYREGRFDTMVEMEDDYSQGYDDAISDAYQIIHRALNKARDETGWSVYEAWNSARLYLDNTDCSDEGVPTEDEMREIIECLSIFAEYLDDSNFFDF